MPKNLKSGEPVKKYFWFKFKDGDQTIVCEEEETKDVEGSIEMLGRKDIWENREHLLEDFDGEFGPEILSP